MSSTGLFFITSVRKSQAGARAFILSGPDRVAKRIDTPLWLDRWALYKVCGSLR